MDMVCLPSPSHESASLGGGQVLGCAMLKPVGSGCDNEVVSELAAFCVHPDYRGSGRGDSLLACLGTNNSFPLHNAACLGLPAAMCNAAVSNPLLGKHCKGISQHHIGG